ncbi:MAG: helix-turn-helix transcriptional regulator [Balneola sp.]
MNSSKQNRLKKAGWKVSDTQEFLGLTEEESAYIEMKLDMAILLKAERRKAGLTQTELAKKLHTSQPRIAKMENGDPSVTLDLILKGLLSLDVQRSEIANALQTA